MPALKEMMERAKPGKEHAEICPGSPENVIEMLEHQEPKTLRPVPGTSLEPISQEENNKSKSSPVLCLFLICSSMKMSTALKIRA
jgi:hypothetical protein